jgi:hypothetical protein
LEGQWCPLMESKMHNHFTHKPRGLQQDIHPIFNKDAWKRLWEIARNQPWYDDQTTYVGTKDGFHYFQRKGLTTGYARIEK